MTWLSLLGELMVAKKSPERLKRFRSARHSEMIFVSKRARHEARVDEARLRGDWGEVARLEATGANLDRRCAAARGRAAAAESRLNGRLREVVLGVG